jgi:2-dehydro-3-deoxy-D-gluconate 5-dehydrogenase
MTDQTILDAFRLNGKSALVTGGGRGIGEAICIRLAETGAAVAVADLDEAAAGRTAHRIQRAGGRSVAIQLDVADPVACTQAVAETESSLGELAILVNNAGIFPFSPATTTTPELWNRVLGVNLNGAFYLAQATAKLLIAQHRDGSVVNIASVDAVRPTGNLAHYDASKGGLVMLTRALALEFAPHRIRVNAVAPGAIDTPGAKASMSAGVPAGVNPADLLKAFLARIPLGRMGSPDDIAGAVVFLAGGAAAYVTGALLVVDGGYLVA